MSEEKKGNEDNSNEAIIERVKTTLKENPSSLYLMKKGDYSVHVLIEEVKNLASRKENSLPKPIVKVTCFGETKRTSKPPEDCEAYTFNEHLYFDATDLSADTLDSSKILIEVYDYHNFEKEYYFGIQEFDFEYIYSKEKHCIKNLWIALANPSAKDITKINGYLKLSISICSTEDEKVELNPDPSSDSDCMLPPQIKTTYKQLEIYIFKGEQFPDMDNTFGKERTTNKRCDGYLEVKYLGISKSTQTITMKNELIQWNELIEMPVPQPIISQKITFTVKDKNKNTVGSFQLTINDIMNGKYENLTCINIYGTLKAADNSKGGKLMNENPEIGSRWKGRVYLKINYKDVEYPITGVQKITDMDLINAVNNMGRKYLWSLYVKLYSASFLPTENGSYDIKMSVQENSETFVGKEAENRNINWNLCKSFAIQSFTPNLEELPDLIIYLVQKGKEICFQRIKLSQFHLNDDIFVIKLFPEPCVGAVKEIFLSGIVKVKIKLFNRAIDDKAKCETSAFKDGDEFGAKQAKQMGISNILSGGGPRMSFLEDEDLEKMLDENNNIQNEQQDVLNQNKGEFKYFTIVACVYMTRYLIAGDSTGLSDPYCVISIDGEKRETSIKYKCVNGIWNEKLVFDTVCFNYKEQATWPCMLITVLDKDYASSDTLGYSYLWLTDTNYSYNSPKKIKPKWHQLYLKKSNRAQGQILMSFFIFDNDHRDDINKIQIEPETIPFSVEINALGLRDLKPLSFIKIKKPFISFDLNSINVSTVNGENLQPVTTLPNDVGANPNINSVIKFNVKLPKDEIFIPEFQCDVYDHVLGGLSKRVLGIFLVDIKQIISETKRHYKEEYEEAERVTKLLENKNNKNNINNNIGMSEKDDLNNNIIQTSKEDLKIGNGNDINDPLMDTAEPGNIAIENNKKNIIKNNGSFLCQYPSDLNRIYRGKIDNTLLEKEKHNSEYFVIKPSFTIYPLPKKLRQKKEVDSSNQSEKKQNINQENGMREMEDKQNKINIFEEKTDEDNLVEDTKNIPNSELYFPIGYNKNDNPLKVKDNEKMRNMLGEIDLSDDDDEKEGLIKKTEEKITNNKKHYRRIYRKELENVKELALGAPFIKCHLLRNKYEDTLSTLNNLLEAVKDENNKILKRFKPKKSAEKSGKLRAVNNLRMNYIETTEELMRNKELSFDLKNYGFFKGLIRISEKSQYDSHKQYIQNIIDKYKGELPPELTFLTAFDDLGKSILVKRSLIVRVYILELNNLARRDTFSESDPYIKILLGDKELVNERKKAFKDCKNCKWYQYYDLRIELPGSSKLRIQVMDYDALFSDDLVGETSIDIEDRYFDNRWQALENKPIEVRQLYHPDYERSQGEVLMWLEMFDQNEENKLEPWNIEPEPKSTLQMRLIIYETEGMENLDIEDTSDIYVMAFIDGKDKAQTDVHYRCSTGQGSFNWRMLIPIEMPRDKYDLTIQVFDCDILSKDDFICGGRLNLHELIKDVNILDLPLYLNADYYSSLPKEKQKMSNIEFVGKSEDEEGNKFWIRLEKQGKSGGRVLCSLEIVPQWYADLHPVGKGRDEPNMNPYLPPPVGRIRFSLNPFTMLNQLTGPKFRKKCYCIICFACLIIYLIFMIPYIVYFISGEVLNPFNYVSKKKDDNEKKD